MKYIYNTSVNSHDIDYNGIVRASSLLRYCQEAATLQTGNGKDGYNSLLERGRVFLLSRANMSMYAPLHPLDKIEVSTWPCESRGASFLRCARIKKDGETVAELISVWALLDINTGRLLRVTDETPAPEYDDILDLDLPPRFRIPDDVTLALAGEYTVDYQVVDRNRHMNNTFLPDMLLGFLPDMTGKRVISMSLYYASEASLGEVLKVYVSRTDDAGNCWFRCVRRDGRVSSEACIMLDDIR